MAFDVLYWVEDQLEHDKQLHCAQGSLHRWYGPKLSVPRQFFNTQYESMLADPKCLEGVSENHHLLWAKCSLAPDISDSTNHHLTPQSQTTTTYLLNFKLSLKAKPNCMAEKSTIFSSMLSFFRPYKIFEGNFSTLTSSGLIDHF